MALVNPHGEEKRLNPLLLSGEELQEEQQKAKGLPPVTMTSGRALISSCWELEPSAP